MAASILGHSVPTVKKQREMLSLLPPFNSELGPQAIEWLHLGWFFPPQQIQPRQPCTDMPRDQGGSRSCQVGSQYHKSYARGLWPHSGN